MRKRLSTLWRLLAVEKQMKRIAEANLADLQRRTAALQDEQRELVAALNGEGPLHGLFVDAVARKLTRLAEEAERAEAERRVQAGRVLDRSLRVSRAERLVEKVARECRHELEKRDLADLLEQAAGRASLP